MAVERFPLTFLALASHTERRIAMVPKRIRTTLGPTVRSKIQQDPLLLMTPGFALLHRIVPEMLAVHAFTLAKLPFAMERAFGHLNEVEPPILSGLVGEAYRNVGNMKICSRIGIRIEHYGRFLHGTFSFFEHGPGVELWKLEVQCNSNATYVEARLQERGKRAVSLMWPKSRIA